MACRLDGAKSLSEPMLEYCSSPPPPPPLSNKLQWNFNRNSNIFIWENTFENVVCEMSISSRRQCVKRARWSGQWGVTTTLGAFSDIIHEFCNDRFGTEERAAKWPKQLNWREVQKGKLRPQHRALRKQRKEVPVVEKEKIIVPIDDLRKEIKVISRTENNAKERKTVKSGNTETDSSETHIHHAPIRAEQEWFINGSVQRA